MGLFKKILPFLALYSALSMPLSAQYKEKVNPPIEIGFFPSIPFDCTAMADPDIPRTKIELSLGAENSVLTTPIETLAPNVSIAKTLPFVYFNLNTESDTILSLPLLASAQLNFPDLSSIDYKGTLELFLNSPMLDNFTRESRLYLAAGVEKKGSIKLSGLEKKSVSDFFQSVCNGLEADTNLFADAYIIGHNDYSEQFMIFKTGVGNLLDKEKNLHLSVTCEFPSIISLNCFRNAKISPYISMYFEAPLNGETVAKNIENKEYRGIGEIGFRIWGQNEESVVLDLKIDSYTGTSPPKVSTELKLNL